MGELSQLSGSDVVRVLEKLSFREARQRGSHVVLKCTDSNGTRGCVVPMHKRVALGTLLGLLKQAGVSRTDFESNL